MRGVGFCGGEDSTEATVAAISDESKSVDEAVGEVDVDVDVEASAEVKAEEDADADAIAEADAMEEVSNAEVDA